MKLRCKACGLIIDEKSIKDKCPACGVLKSAFEPYQSRVSEKREAFLKLHIHPIIVHLPQGLVVFFILLLAGWILLPDGFFLKNEVLSSLKITGFALPFVSIAGFISGLIDGKIRFKKLGTTYLIKKIIIGTLLILSVIIMDILFITGLISTILIIFFGLFFITCSALLGKIGGMLIHAVMGGK
jgi:hypothetical protein